MPAAGARPDRRAVTQHEERAGPWALARSTRALLVYLGAEAEAQAAAGAFFLLNARRTRDA